MILTIQQEAESQIGEKNEIQIHPVYSKHALYSKIQKD